MSCVSSLIAVHLESGEAAVPLFARFSYSADNPYAVKADFLDGLAVLASWQFDRQMLAEGARRPVGEGDVTFQPRRGRAATKSASACATTATAEQNLRCCVRMPARCKVSWTGLTPLSAKERSSSISTRPWRSCCPAEGPGRAPGLTDGAARRNRTLPVRHRTSRRGRSGSARFRSVPTARGFPTQPCRSAVRTFQGPACTGGVRAGAVDYGRPGRLCRTGPGSGRYGTAPPLSQTASAMTTSISCRWSSVR